MKRAKLSLFRLMSDAEKWRAIEVADIPTASATDSIWGWCSLVHNCLELVFTFSKGGKHTDNLSKLVTVASPISESAIQQALKSLINFPPNMEVRAQFVYSLEKMPIGAAFVIHRPESDVKEPFALMQTHLTNALARKQAAEKSKEIKQRYHTKLKSTERQLSTLNKELATLKLDNQKLEKQMLHQRNHDHATDMLNRNGLENALNASFNNTIIAEGKAYLSVILVQFTNGERVQARIGCEGLDQLLTEFEQKVADLTSQIHYFSRISTTELALATVVPAFDDQYLPMLCSQIANIAKQGFIYHSQEVHLHTYMGVANSYHTQDPAQLINNAFHAALACKESGELVTFFTQADQQDQKAFNQLEHYLLQAVRNDDLILYFQPKVELNSQKWIGAEVLLRWKHPVLGDISNEALIHMAEQNGLIIEVGYFVLRNAIDRASEWIEFAPDFCLSINVSAKQICSPVFADKVTALLEQYELPPRNLELELTESCLVSNFDIAKSNIETLTDLGVKFALDDFGTGYASFNYLKKLPFHALKIDKEFLTNVLDNAQDKSILRSIITIAKKLNKQVVVEGVEALEQHQFVADEQCDIGQGYYYAKPMPRDIFEIQLQKQYPSPTQFIIR